MTGTLLHRGRAGWLQPLCRATCWCVCQVHLPGSFTPAPTQGQAHRRPQVVTGMTHVSDGCMCQGSQGSAPGVWPGAPGVRQACVPCVGTALRRLLQQRFAPAGWTSGLEGGWPPSRLLYCAGISLYQAHTEHCWVLDEPLKTSGSQALGLGVEGPRPALSCPGDSVAPVLP